ncbi:MAG: hypothetical protein J7M39_08620 [Anaerolineae bacterium]|nr:hypothetical protein [Anaerolineae bacterium]
MRRDHSEVRLQTRVVESTERVCWRIYPLGIWTREGVHAALRSIPTQVMTLPTALHCALPATLSMAVKIQVRWSYRWSQSSNQEHYTEGM